MLWWQTWNRKVLYSLIGQITGDYRALRTIVTSGIGTLLVGGMKNGQSLWRYIMLVAVKRPRIKVNVHGTGERMVAMVLKEKFPSAEIHEDDDRVPYRETSFAREMKHASTSGRRLWVYRDNAGLTMKELAEKSGISKSHLSEMENDKRAIGIRTARKLGTALRCNYLRFL